jgi:hypothetical protein
MMPAWFIAGVVSLAMWVWLIAIAVDVVHALS